MPRYREIISYPEMVQREGLALQKGMNFRVRGGVRPLLDNHVKSVEQLPYEIAWQCKYHDG